MAKQASFRFELLARPTRNKKYPIRLCITIDGKRSRSMTSIELKSPKDWNPKCKGEKWVRESEPNHKEWNAALAEILEEAKRKFRELSKDNPVSSTMVTKSIQSKNDDLSKSFMEYTKKRMEEIYNAGGYRNWKKYNGFYNKLEAFLKAEKKKDLLFCEITPEFISKFDSYLHTLRNERHPEKVLHQNTIQVVFNVFRAILSNAIKNNVAGMENNPFGDGKIHIKGINTEKEKLNKLEIEAIENLQLEEDSIIWNCRNAFLFSFYCAGIRAGDLIQLRWCNISSDGRLKYQMGKNHKEKDLYLVGQAQAILNLYHPSEKKPTDFIFPFMDSNKPYSSAISQEEKDTLPMELKRKLMDDISAKNALLNKYLKKIAEMAHIEKKLSMHISRHSFAKVAKEEGTDNLSLKDMMGHSSIKVTETYMGNFDTKRNDDALKKIFNDKKSSDKEKIMMMLEEMDAQQIATLLSVLQKQA